MGHFECQRAEVGCDWRFCDGCRSRLCGGTDVVCNSPVYCIMASLWPNSVLLVGRFPSIVRICGSSPLDQGEKSLIPLPLRCDVSYARLGYPRKSFLLAEGYHCLKLVSQSANFPLLVLIPLKPIINPPSPILQIQSAENCRSISSSFPRKHVLQYPWLFWPEKN